MRLVTNKYKCVENPKIMSDSELKFRNFGVKTFRKILNIFFVYPYKWAK